MGNEQGSRMKWMIYKTRNAVHEVWALFYEHWQLTGYFNTKVSYINFHFKKDNSNYSVENGLIKS